MEATALQCPVCSRNGFKRLTRHLSQVHGLSKEEVLARWPNIQLEIQPNRVPVCSVCGDPVIGASPRAAYVKCEGCTPSDDREKVRCEICGVERRRLGAHLKSAHNMTPAQYQALLPGALVEVPGTRERSKECREKQSATATRRWKNPEEREAQSERLQESAPWKGKNLSPEHRQAISEGCSGVSPNLSAEEIERRTRQLHQGYKDTLADLIEGPRIRKKFSEGVQRRIARGEQVGMMNPESQRKSYESRVRNGTLIPPNSGRGISGFRRGLNHYTRSTLEANFARVLLAMGVPYLYEPRVFKLTLVDGKVCHYTPDFYLEKPLKLGERVVVEAGWVELKGWRHKDGSLPGNAQEKLDALQEHVRTLEPESSDWPGLNVSVLVSSDPEWTAIRAMCRPICPWERQGFNLRTHPEVFGEVV